MEVRLLPINKDEVINKLYVACRTCYSAGTPQEQYEKVKEVSEEKKLKLIKHVLDSQHLSVVEHQQLTFLISGISRACSMQLIRHRHASISQQSQRYCEFKEGKFDYVIPKSIEKDEYLKGIFEGTMQHLSDVYKKFIDCGVQAEDARAILPNACTTNLTWSCNIRELMHIASERKCMMAQDEIRKLVNLMTKEVVKELPFLKDYLVEKCSQLGYCPESKKRSCGRKPVREEVFKKS